MGSVISSPVHVLTEEQQRRKTQIEERAKSIANNDKKIIKFLLLGAGECGKSTIMKQMKILHLNGFTDKEKIHYKFLIRQNVLESIQTLCEAMNDLTDTAYEKPENEKEAERILAMEEASHLVLSDAPKLKEVFADTGVKAVFARSREYHLLDSAPYFIEHSAKILEEGYIPSNDDILRCRLATTGIHQTKFFIDNLSFRMFDVGGQRGERKKWIHCFEHVTAILYIASLIEFDQVLAEDRERNRLEESLALFSGIINLPWFLKASIILFLNKMDLFKIKITKINISEYFPEYLYKHNYKDGNVEQGKIFIENKYLDMNEDKSKTIYVHPTEATNTGNISFVWLCTRHIILERNLSKSGLAFGI